MEDLEYITKDALMMCDQGAAPDFFKPTFNQKTKIHGCLVATKVDFVPLSNIPSFKICKFTQKPCMPETSPWQDTWQTKVNGEETLIGRSKCKCAIGGTIEFMTSGQVPLPDEAMEEVEHLQKTAQKALDDSGYGDSVGETGFVEGMIPIWGSGRDLINDIQTGDGWGIVMNAGFLIWDAGSIVAGVFTAGGGTAAMQGGKASLKGVLKAGAKKIGKEVLEGLGKASFKKLSKAALKESMCNLAGKLSRNIVKACFTGDTLVYTKNGLKCIKDIKIGEKVYGYDLDKKKILLTNVCNIFISEIEIVLEIVLENGINIRTTPNHPFLAKDGWKDAECLAIGDYLFTNKKLWTRIKALNYFEERIKVYNLNVENTHSYFVSIDGVLVHNSCADELLKVIDDALKKVMSDPNKIAHILQDHHDWHKLVPNKSWDGVSEIIEKVMKEGTEDVYKTVNKKVLEIGGETVEVTYKKIGDKIFISDAWVKSQ